MTRLLTFELMPRGSLNTSYYLSSYLGKDAFRDLINLAEQSDPAVFEGQVAISQSFPTHNSVSNRGPG